MEKSPNIVESHHIVKIDAKPQVVLLIAPGLVVVESRLHSRLQKIDDNDSDDDDDRVT